MPHLYFSFFEKCATYYHYLSLFLLCFALFCHVVPETPSLHSVYIWIIVFHIILNHGVFLRQSQREITLRDSLQKFITLHKARSVYLWGWCRMLVEIELLPRGWPHGVPSMPKNLKKVQIYPNPVITLLEVNSSTLHNLHYIVLALCKAARPAPKKEKIKILVL